jgi:hypothetical protein
MIINPIEFIVQFGVPTIFVSYNLVIPLISIPAIVMLLRKIIPLKG